MLILRKNLFGNDLTVYHEKCRSTIKPRGINFLSDIFSDRYFGFLPPNLRFDLSKKISTNILIRSLDIINCRRTDIEDRQAESVLSITVFVGNYVFLI